MKRLTLTFIITVLSIFSVNEVQAVTNNVNNQCLVDSISDGLESNKTTLFYMYSNNEGMYFLDPLAEYENVIFVGYNDYKLTPELKIDTEKLHHGKKFVGVFSDSDLWELIGLSEMEEN